MIALTILITLSLLGILTKLSPENKSKIYYGRDNQGRFIRASKSKKIQYVGGSHPYVTNI